ncbi:hypothetical protein L207DRAFT_535960 [Hyaloscypha variabilis F]|uniref:Uncharacterized protein n=1 Tax=Hyaloscypha variabilis (strain UAMH 11265 / GT02V1 / F) TaxID=1149755 RepID=A0A2J6R2A6_HYAVF|nr:hypothetical protein L207DRAFT_535960 [Hyaloscypha variabilis F]
MEPSIQAPVGQKRKQPHDEDQMPNPIIWPQSNDSRVPAIEEQGQQNSITTMIPMGQSRANQQALQLELEQTKVAEAQINVNAELQRLRIREQKHIAYEKSLTEGYTTTMAIISQLQAENNKMTKSMEQKDHTIDNVLKHNERLESKIDRLETDIEKLERAKQQLRAEKGELAEVAGNSMNDIKDLKGQVQQLQNEKIEMAGHHVDFQNARAARTLELEVQVKCINTHQADREDRPEAEREQYKLQIQRLESAREDRNNVIHSLNNHAAGLRFENTALARENQESKSQCQKLDAKVTELQENNSKLEKLVADLRDKNETLEASNENLRTENQQLRAANRDLSRQLMLKLSVSAAVHRGVKTYWHVDRTS